MQGEDPGTFTWFSETAVSRSISSWISIAGLHDLHGLPPTPRCARSWLMQFSISAWPQAPQKPIKIRMQIGAQVDFN